MYEQTAAYGIWKNRWTEWESLKNIEGYVNKTSLIWWPTGRLTVPHAYPMGNTHHGPCLNPLSSLDPTLRIPTVDRVKQINHLMLKHPRLTTGMSFLSSFDQLHLGSFCQEFISKRGISLPILLLILLRGWGKTMGNVHYRITKRV